MKIAIIRIAAEEERGGMSLRLMDPCRFQIKKARKLLMSPPVHKVGMTMTKQKAKNKRGSGHLKIIARYFGSLGRNK